MIINNLSQEEIDLLLELAKEKKQKALKEYTPDAIRLGYVDEENIEFLDTLITKLEEALLKL